MSAYATGVFPPVYSFSNQTTTKTEPEQQCRECVDVSQDGSNHGSPWSKQTPRRKSGVPVQFGKSQTNNKERKVGDMDKSSVNLKSSGDVTISVKDVKLDPVMLVQSLTRKKQSSPSRASNQSGTKATNRELQSPPLLPMLSSTSQSQQSHRHVPTDKAGIGRQYGQEEAFKFVLVVHFNGRRYTATRSLPRIYQLRDDLFREVETMQKLSRQKQKRRFVDDIFKTSDDLNYCEEDTEIYSVPDLPDCREQSFHRGFTMLQALLHNYCPAMEQWLALVADRFPQSESLGRFLWEPVSGVPNLKKQENTAARKRAFSNKSYSSLESIKEVGDLVVEDEEKDCGGN